MIKKLKNKLGNYKQKLKKHLEEVVRIKTSPHSIASGFALGTAIAVLPTFGLGVFIGLLFLLIFKKVSKVSMLIAFAIWNPLVLFSLYGLSYKIGDLILGDLPVKTYKFWLWNQLFNYSRRFLIGNLISTILITTASYILIYFLAKKYQKKYKKIIKESV